MKISIKNILLFACFAALYTFFSCEKDKEIYTEPIKIGKGEESLTEVSINRQTTRDIVLSGGNNKFLVNVADSKIATAKMVQDTLKLTGLFEGETYATILSLDMKATLQIKVRPNELKFTRDELKMRPKEINRTISLGGGNIVKIEENDPDNIIEYRWTNNGVLEITAEYEGEASLIARSEGIEPKELKITVESEDANGYLQEVGFYNTTSRTVGRNINPKIIVMRKEMGTLLKSNNDLSVFAPDNTYCWIPPVNNPKVGEMVALNIEANFTKEGFKSGLQKLKVVEVREAKKQVVLRGKTFKFVLPYN